MIGIIDYNMNNLTCVRSAEPNYLGFKSVIIKNPEKIDKVDKIILPGVGAFGDAIQNLKKKKKIIEALNETVIVKKKPFLGICLGAQLICKESDEHGKNFGFGWFKNEVKKIIPRKSFRVPHNCSWNNIIVNNKSSLLLKNINNESLFYFNHSHAIVQKNLENVSASCDHVVKLGSYYRKK